MGAMLWLTSCASTASDVCPPLKVYTRAFSNRLADELEALPMESTVQTVVIDYYQLRRQIEACRERRVFEHSRRY